MFKKNILFEPDTCMQFLGVPYVWNAFSNMAMHYIYIKADNGTTIKHSVSCNREEMFYRHSRSKLHNIWYQILICHLEVVEEFVCLFYADKSICWIYVIAISAYKLVDEYIKINKTAIQMYIYVIGSELILRSKKIHILFIKYKTLWNTSLTTSSYNCRQILK
jgi:hypothetical protein